MAQAGDQTLQLRTTASPPNISGAKARLLKTALSGEGRFPGVSTAPIPRRPPGATAPLTPEQRQVWLHAALAADLPLYNEACTVTCNGPVDRHALKSALNEIVRRHEIWRTGFEPRGGEVEQRVWPEAQVPLQYTDLAGLPRPEAETEAKRLAAADAREAFDFSRPPLVRARLVRLAEDDHRLYLSLHHLIFDGVSVGQVLLPELLALYEAAAAHRPAALPAPGLQFADYAIWRVAQASSPAVRRELDYWKATLAGGPPDLELPTDKPRPHAPSWAGATERFRLERPLVQRLKALARAEGASLYMVLLAGFSALLNRYSGQQDFAVGAPVETRIRPELQGVMGCFLNTVALRCRPRPEQSFREHLAGCAETVAGALSARSAPFEEVVRTLQPRREANRHPIFSTMLSLAPPAILPPGWRLEPTDPGMEPAKFDLFLSFEEDGGGLRGRLNYSTELFEAATARRFAGHLTRLLDAAVADPGARLCNLPLLAPAEREALLDMGRGPSRELPETTAADLVRRQAAATPDAVAARTEQGAWSYRELDRRADEIAAALVARGVGRDRLAGVCLRRSFEMLAALIGVNRAGGAYLPLDPEAPAERLRMIVDDAAPVVVLADHSTQAAMAQLGAPVLVADSIGPAPSPPAASRARPEDLAYAIYTSGSTGRPKGVEISHRSLVNLLRSMQREPGFAASDRMLALTSLSFDIAQLELWLPLVCGGEVVIGPAGVAADPERLAGLIEQSACSVIQATPATWRGLIDAGWRGRADLKLLCGGEALPARLAETLADCGGSLWNLYGPTETTIWSTLDRIDGRAARTPIGRPIDNTSVYVLEPHGALAPQGVPGELHIGGAGVGRGYRGRAELTAERFVQRPAICGERLYRTGDQARWRADGRLEWLGRLDNQVKIRGFRVELEEVELAMAAHPDVAMAAARVFPDAAGEGALVGYVAPRVEGFDAAQLREHLRRILPGYMIPSEIVTQPVLPMTVSRKVDRQALAPPEQLRATTRFTPPATAAEAALAAIWEEVLGRTPVGVDDDFFELGGHSLLVARLLRRVEEKFGRKLGMAAIFDAPDVRRMAALLEGGRAVPRTINIQPQGARPRLFWIDAGPAFRPLSLALGPDQPFLGIELEEDDERSLDFDFTLRDVGRRMIDAITSVQPHGPYYIGGYCNSGVVAHQTARLLAEAGVEVPLLCMVHAPFYPKLRDMRAWQIELSKVQQHVVEVARRGPKGGLDYALVRGRAAWERRRAGPPPASPFRRKFHAACVNYDPGRYGGPVLLIQPEERPGFMEYARHWATVIDGPFEQRVLPGDHISILRSPNVLRVGEALARSLAAAEAARSHGGRR